MFMKFNMSAQVYQSLQNNLDEFKLQQKDMIENPTISPEEKRNLENLCMQYIQTVDYLLNHCQIINSNNREIPFVTSGSEVELENVHSNRSHLVEIVSPSQFANKQKSDRAKASYLSPIGRALFLKKTGETVSVKAPGGHTEYIVKRIIMPE